MGLLWTYRLGEVTLRNRIVMAPMTRSRALSGNVPSPLVAQHDPVMVAAGDPMGARQ